MDGLVTLERDLRVHRRRIDARDLFGADVRRMLADDATESVSPYSG